MHVRPFTIGFTTCSKEIAICDLLFICVAGIGLPAQKKKKKKKNLPLGFDLADFRQKVPWERSRVAFSQVIFGENIADYLVPYYNGKYVEAPVY